MPKLYHYTSLYHAPAILEEGISRGEVPTSETEGTIGVSLTRDSAARRQMWCRNTKMILQDKVVLIDKTAVRLTVDIPDTDLRFFTWKEAARRLGVTPAWYRKLNNSGGGGANDWFVYFGVIPAAWIVNVELKGQFGYEKAGPGVFPQMSIVFTTCSQVGGVKISKFSTEEALRRMGVAI